MRERNYSKIVFASFVALTIGVLFAFMLDGTLTEGISDANYEEHQTEMANMEVDSQLRANVMSMANAVKDEVQNDMTEQDARDNDKITNKKRIDNFDYDKNYNMAENDREENLVVEAYFLKQDYYEGKATGKDVKDIHDMAYGGFYD